MEKIKPKTAVGKFLDRLPDNFERNIELNTKNIAFGEKTGESLIFELPSKKKIKFVPKIIKTKKCKVWKGNIRVQEFLNDQNTKDLKEKIQAQGQLIPVLARTIKNNLDFTHELIYGSRRLYVCSCLDLDIKILEADLDDNDALLFMDAENSGRENVSAYESAQAYKYWLDNKIFKNQNELAEKLGITRSWLNKILSLNKIPIEIISSISGPQNLSIKQGLELIKCLTEREINVQSIVKRLTKDNSCPVTPEQIFQNILNNKPIKTTKQENQNEEQTQTNGAAEISYKLLYSKKGQPVCKIIYSKQKKITLTFDYKFFNLVKEIEETIQKKF